MAYTLEEERGKPTPPPRRTRWIFKLLGLLLVPLAGWMAWYSYREGRIPDWLNPEEQRRAKSVAKGDLGHAYDWMRANLEQLRARIKGPPPETPQQVKDLVSESRDNVQAPPPKEDKPKTLSVLDEAREEYRRGEEAYAKSDPSGSTDEVQANLRLAEPRFAHCLELLDKAAKEQADAKEREKLEQNAARRLYDCRKRMALPR
ncbi:MAG TPA: hypothetical protein VGP72_33315 [Planctomycetota bacterium]|jgi:hypothetical protein